MQRDGSHRTGTHGTSEAQPLCFIVPPHILKGIAENGTDQQRERALRGLGLGARFRERRQILGSLRFGYTPTGELRRTVYDTRHSEELPGERVRGEGGKPTKDQEVTEAYDGAGSTYTLYREVFNRNSVDDLGMRLDSTVHFSLDLDNAFWDGTQMVYGDGDGEIFDRFTKSVDVIGHEMTHGVTQFTAGLEYRDQSGALNESISDVFGSLVKQFSLKQTVDEADWLIGQGLLMKKIKGQALRSMKAPGTAYNDPVLGGKDPQPAHMSDYAEMTADRGGVHINSGIPNQAFYLAAKKMSDSKVSAYAWEDAGRIWYAALTTRLTPKAQFLDAANATIGAVVDLLGSGSEQEKAVWSAWHEVGVLR